MRIVGADPGVGVGLRGGAGSLAAVGHLEWFERPEPSSDSVLIAAFSGWNDAGDAATESAKYLRRRFRCHPVAQIDPEYFYDFASVRPSVQVVDGERQIDWPTPDVRIGEADDGRTVITVLGVEPRLRWRTFCDVIIEMANSLGVSTVVTLGALLTDTHHNAPINVVGASNNAALNLTMGLRQSTYEGPTGIIGVLNDACHRAGFASVSFWATVPTYVHNYPSPKAALALAERVARFMGINLGESELHSAAANYGHQIDELVAGDDTLAQYAQQILEESAAEAVEDFSEMVENPDGLFDELEQFLRQQEPD